MTLPAMTLNLEYGIKVPIEPGLVACKENKVRKEQLDTLTHYNLIHYNFTATYEEIRGIHLLLLSLSIDQH